MRVAPLALLCALAACGGGGATKPDTTVRSSDTRGTAALELKLPALDGGELDIASLRGKLVVLHVFTTWSLAAQAEIDDLSVVDDTDDVVVVGIAIDDQPALVAPWRNGAGVRYLVTIASDAVRDGSSALGPITIVPTTLILDAKGVVRARAERALGKGELSIIVSQVREGL